MSDIKMSERFGRVPDFDIEEFIDDDRNFAIPNVNLCYQDINKAVNNHDRLVEENSKFKSSNNEQITDLKKIYVMLHEFYDDHDFDGSTCDLAIVDLIYKMEGRQYD